MEQTTTVVNERQVSPHNTGGDSHDIPLLESHEVPQPDSQEVPLPNSEDMLQPEDLALLVLKENKVWKIGMFTHIYLCMFLLLNYYLFSSNINIRHILILPMQTKMIKLKFWMSVTPASYIVSWMENGS